MLKRTLYFTTPATLSLKDCQLVVSRNRNEDESVTTIPIEDVGIVVIENLQIIITIPLLSALSQNNVAVIFCNERHMPQSILHNLDVNATAGLTIRRQIEATEPMRKNIWKQIIESKIKNQSLLLNKLQKNGDILKPYYTAVKSGDSDNREGLAARLYWKELFGDDFYRNREAEGINTLLNYGYSILRAGVARALVGSGLMPSIGVFHKNRSNAFPLADDMMEPYRPFVDECVYELCEEGLFELSTETKARLISVLSKDTVFDDVIRPLSIGLAISSSSLAKFYDKGTLKLSFPALVRL